MKTNYFYESEHDKANAVHFHQGGKCTTLPHFHRCFEILYVLDGSASVTVSGNTFATHKDEIAFVHKCSVHELNTDDDYVDYVLVIGSRFSEDFSAFFQSKTLPPLLNDREFNRTLLPYFTELHEYAKKKNCDEREELIKKGLINVIVGKMLERYESVPVTTTPNLNIIVQALNYIDEHSDEPITLDSISSEFGYNKYYFSRLFNMYIGDTLNSYINMVRVRKVVSLAQRDESLRLSELVFECGFDSMTTFYRTFSKYYEKPPTKLFKNE